MDLSQIYFLIIMLGAILLFTTDYLRVDIVAVLIILSLSITGIISVEQAFSGFSSEPAIIVCAVFILSAGLSFTGVTEVIGQWVGRLAGDSETRSNLVIMCGVAMLSAFTHHLMITAMMLPIVMQHCRDKNLHSSRLLIPMATSASLGTTLTLIGAPALLLANSILKRSEIPALGFFDVGMVGLPVVIASFTFILLTSWILPKRSGMDTSDERFKLSEISTELVIPEGSRWIGLKYTEFKEQTEKRFQIFAWLRGNRRVLLPDAVLEQGDVLLVKIGADELVSIEEKLGLAINAVKKYGPNVDKETTTLAGHDSQIFQGIIAPKSRFIGNTLSGLHFFNRYGAIAVGLWRKKGWFKDEISETPLEEGDLVVLWGQEQNLERLTHHRGFLMFMPFHGQPKRRLKMRLAAGIMIASILTAAMGWLPAYVAFVAGALAMILTKCINVDQGYEAIETRIFVMIAGMIPLGIAMEKTGVDKLLADLVLQYTQGWPTFSMLLVFFWFAALLTQILSDAATTVLIAPIAIAFAEKAHIAPTAAVITVTIGAIASFLTPIGHHGNLLILSPGGYKFTDFLKIGLPLTIIISLITCYMSMIVWTLAAN